VQDGVETALRALRGVRPSLGPARGRVAPQVDHLHLALPDGRAVERLSRTGTLSSNVGSQPCRWRIASSSAGKPAGPCGHGSGRASSREPSSVMKGVDLFNPRSSVESEIVNSFKIALRWRSKLRAMSDSCRCRTREERGPRRPRRSSLRRMADLERSAVPCTCGCGCLCPLKRGADRGVLDLRKRQTGQANPRWALHVWHLAHVFVRSLRRASLTLWAKPKTDHYPKALPAAWLGRGASRRSGDVNRSGRARAAGPLSVRCRQGVPRGRRRTASGPKRVPEPTTSRAPPPNRARSPGEDLSEPHPLGPESM
jgi:hypothetical protein